MTQNIIIAYSIVGLPAGGAYVFGLMHVTIVRDIVTRFSSPVSWIELSKSAVPVFQPFSALFSFKTGFLHSFELVLLDFL